MSDLSEYEVRDIVENYLHDKLRVFVTAEKVMDGCDEAIKISVDIKLNESSIDCDSDTVIYKFNSI